MRKIINFLLALGWHLYRIATFRPAFSCLSDTGTTLLSFAAVYAGGALLRWAWAYDQSLLSKPGGILAFVLGTALFPSLILVWTSVSNTSRVIVAVLMGNSAVIDLGVTTAYVVGLVPSVRGSHWTTLELLLACLLMLRFARLPAEIRQPGYIPGKTPEPKSAA